MTIFMLVEFVEKVTDLLAHDVPLKESVLYFIYKLPFIFSLISPVAVLLSSWSRSGYSQNTPSLRR